MSQTNGTEYDIYYSQIPVQQNQLGNNLFRDLAIQIVGDTPIEEKTVVAVDGSGNTYTETVYQINPYCNNMIISISWSLFLTTCLLTFGLIRSIFNIFSGGGRD